MFTSRLQQVTWVERHATKGPGQQDVQRFDIICVFQPLDPFTFESNLTVSGDMTEGSEDKEDQPSPDDPERLNQRHQLLCGDVLSTNVSFPIFLFI